MWMCEYQSDFENFQNPQTIFKKIWNFVILEEERWCTENEKKGRMEANNRSEKR